MWLVKHIFSYDAANFREGIRGKFDITLTDKYLKEGNIFLEKAKTKSPI